MNKQINSINIYYSDLDRMITQCVDSIMKDIESDLELWFWEKACIGGKHLKLRWAEKDESSVAVESFVLNKIESFIKENPGEEYTPHNNAATERLIETENRNIVEDLSNFKPNSVQVVGYERLASNEASGELVDILNHFLNDTKGICSEIIKSDIDRNRTALQLFIIFSLEQYSNMERGSIVFRAHWDNYENWFKPEILPQKIKQNYEKNKDKIHELMNELIENYQTGKFRDNKIYDEWVQIIRKYRAIVNQKQSENVILLQTPTTSADVVSVKEDLDSQEENSRSKDFLSKLYSEPDYLGKLAENKGLEMTKIMVNLIYHVTSNIGISAFERMAFCYYIHRSVEEINGIDLLNNLEEGMSEVLGRNIQTV